jgi:hypothetical protein
LAESRTISGKSVRTAQRLALIQVLVDHRAHG